MRGFSILMTRPIVVTDEGVKLCRPDGLLAARLSCPYAVAMDRSDPFAGPPDLLTRRARRVFTERGSLISPMAAAMSLLRTRGESPSADFQDFYFA